MYWQFMENPWEYNFEMEKLLSENFSFRKVNGKK